MEKEGEVTLGLCMKEDDVERKLLQMQEGT
jgi:hypothetical protein